MAFRALKVDKDAKGIRLFVFLRRWRGLCRAKQDGRSDGLNFVDSFYYLNEFGGVATALRPVNDDVVFSGQTQSEIAVMSRRFDERRRRWRRHGSIAAAGRRFIHSTDAAAHSRCALNVGPSPGDGRRWQQRRHGTCFGTRNEDVRRRRRKKPHGRRETSISTGRGSHHFWGSQFLYFRNDLLMDCFFFFWFFFFFVFLKFWNFGWEVYRHHKEYIVEFPSLLDFSITLNVSLKRTDGTTSSGHFDGPFAVESRSTGTFQTLAFNSAGFAFAVDAIHWSEWSHHWMPSRPV